MEAEFLAKNFIYIYILKFNSISRRKNGWIFLNGNFSLESFKNILQRYEKLVFFIIHDCF